MSRVAVYAGSFDPVTLGHEDIVRGIRAMTDFEYEQVIAHANKTQAPDIETVFLVTRPDLSYVSSSVVRELVNHGGDVSHFVSPHVVRRLLGPRA